MFKIAPGFSPREFTVVRKKIEGSVAILEGIGKIAIFGIGSPQEFHGTIKLVKENGEWRFDDQHWERKEP